MWRPMLRAFTLVTKLGIEKAIEVLFFIKYDTLNVSYLITSEALKSIQILVLAKMSQDNL